MLSGPVVVGVDGSASSLRALRWAIEYGRLAAVQVEVLMAWDLPPTYGVPASFEDVDFEAFAKRDLDDTVREGAGAVGAVTGRLERGHPAPLLVAASEQAQLLVVGSSGHGGFAGMLLGSVSQFCLQHAHCPVVVVRGRAEM